MTADFTDIWGIHPQDNQLRQQSFQVGQMPTYNEALPFANNSQMLSDGFSVQAKFHRGLVKPISGLLQMSSDQEGVALRNSVSPLMNDIFKGPTMKIEAALKKAGVRDEYIDYLRYIFAIDDPTIDDELNEDEALAVMAYTFEGGHSVDRGNSNISNVPYAFENEEEYDNLLLWIFCNEAENTAQLYSVLNKETAEVFKYPSRKDSFLDKWQPFLKLFYSGLSKNSIMSGNTLYRGTIWYYNIPWNDVLKKKQLTLTLESTTSTSTSEEIGLEFAIDYAKEMIEKQILNPAGFHLPAVLLEMRPFGKQMFGYSSGKRVMFRGEEEVFFFPGTVFGIKKVKTLRSWKNKDFGTHLGLPVIVYHVTLQTVPSTFTASPQPEGRTTMKK